jgi:hypothetical protein
MPHPPWCHPTHCTVGKAIAGPGAHKGKPVRLPKATVWVEQIPGGPELVAVGRLRLAPVEAIEVAEALCAQAAVLA